MIEDQAAIKQKIADWYNIDVAVLYGTKILIAEYYCRYEGVSVVIFKQDGKLFEVNGSHCSCYGLEGQWDPEECTSEYLDKKLTDSWYYSELGIHEQVRDILALL